MASIAMNERIEIDGESGKVIGFCADLLMIAWDDAEKECSWVDHKTVKRITEH
jgi:hypothetical protein